MKSREQTPQTVPAPETPRICLIAALAANRVIGRNNALPWHLPADLKRFKALTLGHPVLMGRKTHESIGRPLPGRRNLVITRSRGYSAPGCEVVHSLDEAIAACRGAEVIFIIGGAELYRESLPRAHSLEFTEIQAEFEGDATFPEFCLNEWRETAREIHADEAGTAFRYDFVRYERMDDSKPGNGSGFRLTLLGGFRLEDAHGKAIPVASRKAQGMLAVLALSSPGAVTRERIAAMFWGELADERARHSLRQLLSSLRRDTGIVDASGETLSLDRLVCAVDAVEFHRLARSTDPKELEAAVALYAGPLLDGLLPKEEEFGEWLRFERMQLAKLAALAMARLAAHCAGAEDHENAVRILRRWLGDDPANEEAHRALMRSLDALGRRSEALAQYQVCKELLHKQFGVEPDAATLALCESIRRTGTGANREGLPAICVLPFANHARTPELDTLAACMAEDLGSQLARTPGFQVVAQAAVATAMQPNPGDIQQIARTLRAHYLISGSLRRPDPGCVRVAIQIVDGESAQYLWTMQRDLASPRANGEVDDFVAGTAAKIEQQLTLAEAREGRKRAHGYDAWDKMRQAGSALFSAGWSEDAVDASVRLYREAIALDPKLALARAQKALIMALASRWGLLRGDAPREEARADAEKALELEPTQSEVLGCAGCALADLGDAERALPLLERAIEENPNNAQAWAALGAIQLMRRQYEPGVESLRRGLRISPTDYRRSVWLTALAGGLAHLQKLDEALAATQSACRADSKFYPAQIVLALVLAKLGKEAEAVKALAEARRIRPGLAIGEIRLWAGRALDRPAASLGL